MRILHVIPHLAVGGTERVVSDLMRFQSETDDPSLCVLGRRPLQENSFGTMVHSYLNFSGSLRDVQGISQCNSTFREVVRGVRPDVIHAHLWPAGLFAAPVARDAGIECVVHVHDSQTWLTSKSVRGVMLRILHRTALKDSVRMIAVSTAVKNYTIANLPWPSDAIRVVHNGVDVDSFRRSEDKPQTANILTIGSAGRLESEKGFAHLIAAAAQLHQAGVAFRLLIAGEGSQRPALQSLIERNGLTEIVQLVGITRDIRSFYDTLDIFVLPSVAAEGLPMTILEAMSMSLPVVATAIAGAPEVIDNHGSHGVLVPQADPLALSNALIALANDSEHRSRIGQRARAHVAQNFTSRQMAEQVRRVYGELN